MVEILDKITTHRKAIAKAIVRVSHQNTIEAVIHKKVPKGDVLEMSKTAGLFAVKKTSDVIPDCHPMPIEYAKISHEIEGLCIHILVEVHTIYKTGVEVEAMYGASVTAMTVYDMLKPIDKGITIEHIALQEKSGGKTDFKKDNGVGLKSAVIVVSNQVFSGDKKNDTGQYILEVLNKNNLDHVSQEVVDEDPDRLVRMVQEYSLTSDILIISGGTGFSKNDKTPELIRPLLEIEIPGIMEWARSYGQNRTPYAMFSRGFSGILNKCLILAVPGSFKGAKETMNALFPHVLHAFKMLHYENKQVNK